jgi:hypothetical protein
MKVLLFLLVVLLVLVCSLDRLFLINDILAKLIYVLQLVL